MGGAFNRTLLRAVFCDHDWGGRGGSRAAPTCFSAANPGESLGALPNGVMGRLARRAPLEGADSCHWRSPGDSTYDGEMDAPARTLVIGLGNPILRDDSVGLRVVRALGPELGDVPGVEVAEDFHGGLRLMERMVGFRRAIVVDAIVTGATPGTLHVLSVDGPATQRSASAHDVDLPTALALGRQAGACLPKTDDILLVGIEAGDVLNFGEQLSPDVERAIPQAVGLILAQLKDERKA